MKILAELRSYNSNSANKHTGDCVPRALSLAYGMDYDETLRELKRIRKERGQDSYRSNIVWMAFVRSQGDKLNHLRADLSKYSYKNGRGFPTLEDWIEDGHESGTYVLAINEPKRGRRAHLVCVEDGDIYDTWDCSSWVVRSYAKISNRHKLVKEAGSGNILDIANAVAEELVSYLKKLSNYDHIDSVSMNEDIDRYDDTTAYMFFTLVTSDIGPNGQRWIAGRSYTKHFVVKQNIKKSDEDNIAANVKRMKQKLYDWVYDINSDLRQAAKAATTEFRSDFMGSKYLASKMPDWAIPFITYADVNNSGYGSKYTIYLGDADIIEGETLTELKEQLAYLKDEYTK